MDNQYKKGKDLTKEPPRSPKVKIGGFVILARTIDKCRAELWGNVGEYHFDCPLDNLLFGFKGIKGDDFKSFVEGGHSDEEIATWVSNQGQKRTNDEIEEWNNKSINEDYSSAPEKKMWLEGENKRVGLSKDATLFDYLIADDKSSYL